MTPVTWIGAGLAALVAGIAILVKGNMVERPHRRRAAVGGGSAAGGADIPDLGGDEEDPFKRYPLGRERGPVTTQTATETLANGPGDPWVSDTRNSEPAVSFASAGDGSGAVAPSPWSPPAAVPSAVPSSPFVATGGGAGARTGTGGWKSVPSSSPLYGPLTQRGISIITAPAPAGGGSAHEVFAV